MAVNDSDEFIDIAHPAGHNVAGSFFLFFGLWWTFCTYWIHLTSKSNSKTSRRKSNLLSILEHDTNDPLARKSWIPQPFLKKVPIEPIGKTLLPSLGVFVELFVDARFDKGWGSHVIFFHYVPGFFDGHFENLNRFYHVCLYSTFIMSGIIDLVSLCVRLPRATSQLFLCFAFYSEAVLFSFHVHDRVLFNNTIHHFLIIFVIACSFFATLRILHPRNLFINAGLSASIILQGTHLIQAGWILYGGIQWDVESHENVKFITALSVWHLFGVSIFMVVTFVSLRCVLARLAKTKRFISLAVNHNVEEEECLILNEDPGTTFSTEGEGERMDSRVEESPA